MTRPEHSLGLFVDACNRRHADALASRFDEDAEFVDVTGPLVARSQRHPPCARVRAGKHLHNSTLTADDRRVKQMTDVIAVVHALMTLSGQTPIGSSGGGAQSSASAHNTDVGPSMDVIGLASDRGVFAPRPGSTASRVLCSSTVPVLVVRLLTNDETRS